MQRNISKYDLFAIVGPAHAEPLAEMLSKKGIKASVIWKGKGPKKRPICYSRNGC